MVYTQPLPPEAMVDGRIQKPPSFRDFHAAHQDLTERDAQRLWEHWLHANIMQNKG